MEIDQALTAIERAGSIDGLASVLVDWRNESGVANLVYHATSVPAFEQPNPVLLLTYDDAWVKHYLQHDYFSIDPVVVAGRNAVLPIDWMSVDHDTSAARHVFAEAESFGVGRHGLTLPIRGPADERALFTVTVNATDDHCHRWWSSYPGWTSLVRIVCSSVRVGRKRTVSRIVPPVATCGATSSHAASGSCVRPRNAVRNSPLPAGRSSPAGS